jgi:hypothetical protein
MTSAVGGLRQATLSVQELWEEALDPQLVTDVESTFAMGPASSLLIPQNSLFSLANDHH